MAQPDFPSDLMRDSKQTMSEFRSELDGFIRNFDSQLERAKALSVIIRDRKKLVTITHDADVGFWSKANIVLDQAASARSSI